MTDLITLTGPLVDHQGATPLAGVTVTATPSRAITRTSDGKDALTGAAATTDETGTFELELVHAAGLRYLIQYRVQGKVYRPYVLDCDSWLAGSTVTIADLPPIAGVPPSAVEDLQAWVLEQLAAVGPGGGLDAEGIQDVVGAMIVAAGGTYDDEAGTITLPSAGGDTTVQIGTVTLPESPTVGLSVSVLADSDTALPEGVTWDSGGEPTITERMLLVFVWSGDDWVGTYGPPIPAVPVAPDTTGPTAGTLGVVVDVTSADGTVTGAADETELAAAPYSFRIDAGTWSAYQAGATYEWTGLDPATEYDFQHRVRDAAGNVTEGAVVTDTTDPEPSDTTPPTPGTLAASAITSDSFTLTVTGASDETALHSQPYDFSLDNGSTWTGYQADATYDATGLDPETEYTCKHRVRDHAGNIAEGTPITVETSVGGAVDLTLRAVGTPFSQSSTNLDVVVSKPTGTIDGDLLVVQIRRYNSLDTPQGPTVVPAGWTPHVEHNSPRAGHWVYSKVASSEPANWTWSFADPQKVLGVCYAFQAGTFDAANPVALVSTVGTAPSSNTVTIPALTTTADRQTSVAMMGTYQPADTTPFTAPAGYAATPDLGDTNADVWLAMSTLTYPTSGTNTGPLAYHASGGSYMTGVQILVNPS